MLCFYSKVKHPFLSMANQKREFSYVNEILEKFYLPCNALHIGSHASLLRGVVIRYVAPTICGGSLLKDKRYKRRRQKNIHNKAKQTNIDLYINNGSLVSWVECSPMVQFHVASYQRL